MCAPIGFVEKIAQLIEYIFINHNKSSILAVDFSL